MEHYLSIFLSGSCAKKKCKRSCKQCGDDIVHRASHAKYCRECAPNKAWLHRISLYGIGRREWNHLLLEQGWTCALCNKEPTCVDHDHSTGRVRGLLCHKCNTHIGSIESHPNWVYRAIQYVKRGKDAVQV